MRNAAPPRLPPTLPSYSIRPIYEPHHAKRALNQHRHSRLEVYQRRIPPALSIRQPLPAPPTNPSRFLALVSLCLTPSSILLGDGQFSSHEVLSAKGKA